MNTPERIAAYKAVLERHDIDPKDDSYSGGEDAAEYLAGDREIERFCVVTMANCGAETVLTYAYSGCDSLENAKLAATANIDDNIYPETPLEIVDLDTGEILTPDWKSIVWAPEVKV